MNAQKWFRPSGSFRLAIALFLLSSACLMSEVYAQSTESTGAGGSHTSQATTPFLVAPSFALASAPSGVALGDLNQDGKLDLVTIDAVSGKVTVFLGTGGGNFASGVEYANGSHPTGIILADVYGDGRTEVIVSNREGSVSVLAVADGGNLELMQTVALGFEPALLAQGDFGADGKAGLAVTSSSGKTLAILLNDGQGNLQKPVVSPLRKSPAAMTVADLNGDGRADLALANTDGTVSVLLGAGSGTFRALSDVSVASGSLSSIAAGDFNRDGKADLAVTQLEDRTVSVLLGKGDGSFAQPQSYAVGTQPMSVAVADLHGDGNTDLVVVNQGSNTLSVLGGNGDGTFRTAQDWVVGNGPLAAVAGDIDGDGHTDLAVIATSTPAVTIAIGKGDGTFQASRSYPAEVNPRAVASADLNGDKLPDLAVTNSCGTDSSCTKTGSVDIFLADAKGGYELSHTYSVGAGPVAVALVDVDGDKHPDAIVLNRTDKTVSVLLAKGDGSFEEPMTFALAAAPVAMAIGDFNEDGKPDLAVVEDCGAQKCAEQGTVEILFGQGAGGFRSGGSYPAGYAPASIAVGDLKQDKNLDLVIANRCGDDASCQSNGTATVLLGSANGRFTAGEEIALGKSPASLALADWSGRGVLDLTVSRAGDNSVAILRGNGDGTFQTPVAYEAGNAPGSLSVADFNGDGKPDLAVINGRDSTVSVFFGKGDGTLNPAMTLPVGKGPEALVAVSPTGGHRAGIVTANGNSSGSPKGTDITFVANLQPAGNGSTQSNTVLSPTTSTQVNSTVTLTATVTDADTLNPIVPTGSVTFSSTAVGSTPAASLVCTNADTPPATVNLNSSGVATCDTESLQGGSYTINAAYSGDSTFATSNATAVTQTITPIASTLSVASSETPSSNVNDSVTFTVSLNPGSASETPFAPSGTVSFSLNTTPVASCANVTINAQGKWTCTLTTLIAPSDTVSATYSTGDPNYTVANPGTTTQTVKPLAATISISSSSPSGSSVNASVTFTAVLNVGSSALTPVAPSGTMSFFLDSNAISTCTGVAKTSQGNWPCVVTGLTGGSHTITATYGGSDPNYTVATQGSTTQTVNAASATLSLASSETPSSNVNDAVTFTVTLNTSGSSTVTPTGKVSFTLNNTAVPSCTGVAKNSMGKWTCVLNTLIAPSDTISATYASDPSYTVANPATLTQTVNPLPSTLTLNTTATTFTVGQSVPFTASISAGAAAETPIKPAGKVSFSLNSVAIASCTNVSVNGSGVWPCSVGNLIAPTDQITATYSSDANYTVANPAMYTLTAGTGTATVKFTPTSQTSDVNQPVTFNVTVTGTPTPTGSVTFSQGGNPLCPPSGLSIVAPATVPSATCTAVFSSAFASGTTITATYSGDANYKSGTTGTATQTVNADPVSVSLSSIPAASATISVNQTVAFTATLVPTYTAGTAVPSAGSVIFTDTTTNTTLCTDTFTTPTTVFACSAGFTTATSHTITAVYNPATTDKNFAAKSGGSGSETITVGAAGTSIAITPPSNSPMVNQSAVFTSTLTFPSGGASPSGTVAYSDSLGSSNPFCTASVTSGVVASCPAYTFSKAGTHAITATFTPNGTSFSMATSPIFNEIVAVGTTSISITAPTSSSASVDQVVTFTATVTPTPAGATNPTGTISFGYVPASMPSATPSPFCAPVAVKTVAGVTSASCTAPVLAAGTYLITATYTSGDANFTAGTVATGNPATMPETVSKTNTTLTVTGPTTEPVVNQPATYTTTLTPAISDTYDGSTLTTPTGNVIFTDGNASNAPVLCVAQPSPTGVVTCPQFSLGTAGTHTIYATYNPASNPLNPTPDQNFASSTFTLTQMVAQDTPKTAVVSSMSTSVATQSVTFTASVSPTYVGTAPTGTINFTVAQTIGANTTNFPCTAGNPVTSESVYSESCTVTFGAGVNDSTTANGNISVTADYVGDSNFKSSASSPALAQVVQNFAPALGQTQITMGQGPATGPANTNITDPFSATAITFATNPVSGFNDPVGVTACTIVPAASGLSCTIVSNPTATTGVVTISSAPGVPIGPYTVQITIGDGKVVALSHTVTLPLNIINQAPSAFTASVGSGTATFQLANPVPATDLSCASVSVSYGNGTYGPPEALSEIGITCSAITVESGTTNGYTFTINAGSSTSTAQLETHGTLLAAAVIGAPLLFLLSLLPVARRQRKALLRILGLALLSVAALHSIACSSGGFTRTTPTVAQSGSFVIDIVDTQNGKSTTVAEVPLVIGN